MGKISDYPEIGDISDFRFIGSDTSDDDATVQAPWALVQAYIDGEISAGAGFTTENAQDAVGGIMDTDDFAYDDATPEIKLSAARIASLAKADTAAQINAAQTWTKPQRASFTTLTDGATITPNLNDNNLFKVTLAGNRALANPSNIASAVGQDILIVIIQDGTGSRTLSFGSQYLFPGGNDPVLSTAAGAIDCIVGTVLSSTQILCSAVKAFA